MKPASDTNVAGSVLTTRFNCRLLSNNEPVRAVVLGTLKDVYGAMPGSDSSHTLGGLD